MPTKKQVLDTVLGIDIAIKPYIPYKNCYVVYANFHEERTQEEPFELIFNIPAESSRLLQTVLELNFYQAPKSKRYFMPSAEIIFRPPHIKYDDNYYQWFEGHYNYTRQSWQPRVNACLVDYHIFYHNEAGQAHQVDFKLPAHLQKAILALSKEYPSEREDANMIVYREKTVAFIEKQLLLAQIKKPEPTAPTKKLKI